MFNIIVIIGSLRKESINKKLVHALDKLNHPLLKFNIIDLNEIPIYNQDNETNMPAAVVNLKKEVENSDGVLFVTPEYNRSIPGMLKNIIDWGTRPYGKNSWAKKPTGIIGMSVGTIGTAVAQSHLRSILVGLEASVLGQPEIYLVYKPDMFDDKNTITNEDTKKFLQGYLDKFSAWVQKYHK